MTVDKRAKRLHLLPRLFQNGAHILVVVAAKGKLIVICSN